jgi:hypothetical protein
MHWLHTKSGVKNTYKKNHTLNYDLELDSLMTIINFFSFPNPTAKNVALLAMLDGEYESHILKMAEHELKGSWSLKTLGNRTTISILESSWTNLTSLLVCDQKTYIFNWLQPDLSF